MNFSSGDFIAMAALGVTVGAYMVREWRAKIAAEAKDAAADTAMDGIVKGLMSKMDEVVRSIVGLEDRRQKHEVDCARVQERTAAAQQRTAEILQEHGKAIGHLQAQIRNVAPGGSAGKIIEIGGKG